MCAAMQAPLHVRRHQIYQTSFASAQQDSALIITLGSINTALQRQCGGTIPGRLTACRILLALTSMSSKETQPFIRAQTRTQPQPVSTPCSSVVPSPSRSSQPEMSVIDSMGLSKRHCAAQSIGVPPGVLFPTDCISVVSGGGGCGSDS
jgi:hypothetical protein